jgi:3-oxoacyl-[acyl-carrier-protein] synthase III
LHDLGAHLSPAASSAVNEWIVERTGIEERRWVSDGETGATLATAASKQAIEPCVRSRTLASAATGGPTGPRD